MDKTLLPLALLFLFFSIFFVSHSMAEISCGDINGYANIMEPANETNEQNAVTFAVNAISQTFDTIAMESGVPHGLSFSLLSR